MNVRIRETTVKVDFEAAPLVWGPADLQNRIGTATFVYESLQNPAVTFVPQAGDDVRIINDAGTYALFVGHIAQVERGGDPIGRRYVLHCQDLSYLFDKILVPADRVYAAGCTDAYVVTDLLFGSWAPGRPPNEIISFSPTDVTGVNSIQSKTWLPPLTIKAGTSLKNALDQIATLAGGTSWFLDTPVIGQPWRVFHWHDLGSVASLIPTTSPYNPVTGWPPPAAAYYYNYSEFIDRTGHYFRVTVDNGAGLTATATNWAAFGDALRTQVSEYGTYIISGGNERILEGPRVTDSTLTTQAAVTQRAWSELAKGRIRKTVRLSVDEVDGGLGPSLKPGMLVDVVHAVWGDADVAPTPHLSREVGTHSRLRGELVPGSRGRYLVQKVTPRLRAKGAQALYAFDLELGDYEDSLETTLAVALG